MPGTLYVVGTPIGNLEDITYRAVRILSEADVIACENKSRTVKLLNHFEIRKHVIEYSPANEENSAKGILKLLEEGKNVALVTDAGMPGISDPGRILTETARRNEIETTPVPGVSAVTTLLSVSGFTSSPFIFVGFLPKTDGKIKKALSPYLGVFGTLVIFESQYRIKKTLHSIKKLFGNVEILIGREMTKVNEEWISGTIDEILDRDFTEKGEFSVAVKLSGK